MYLDEVSDPVHPCQAQQQDYVQGQVVLEAWDGKPHNLQCIAK